MSNWIPLSVYSHYYLGHSTSRAEDIAKRCHELEMKSCCLCDNSSLAGVVSFIKECKKKDIKPILGLELNITEGGTLNFIAMNLNGWKELISLCSTANQAGRNPILSMDQLKELSTENLICYTGHFGSILGNSIFSDISKVFSLRKNNGAKEIAKNEWAGDYLKLAGLLKEIFGDRLYLSVFTGDSGLVANELCTKAARWAGEKLGVRRVGIPRAYYCKKEDAFDHRVLLCIDLKLKLRTAAEMCPDFYKPFFQTSNYHLSMPDGLTEDEIETTGEINSRIEKFSILGKPSLPKFECPDGLDADSYLKQLCRDGWKRKITPKVKKEDIKKYVDRVNEELGVLQKAGLSDYFLIVRDIINYAKSKGRLTGPGRGSVAGCLVSYLVDITEIDPIPYDLIFSRFYNEGRNTEDYTALPDIDCDFPANLREEIIEYIKNKWGRDRVAQVVTYHTIQGRNGLTDVLRVHDSLSFVEIKEVTKNIPEKAKISDDLQEMKDNDEDAKIIRWALENRPEDFRQWAYLDENGKVQGDLARQFEQAMRLEGIKSNTSKHAAAVIIGIDSLARLCPMIKDKSSDEMLCGMEFKDLEEMGLMKVDILSIRFLDKIEGVVSLCRTGRIN